MSKAAKPKASKSKATDAQDVLQFLDSLPEVGHGKRETLKSKAGKATAAGKAGSEGPEVKKSSEKQGEEIFEFLDELERSKLSMNKEKKKGNKKEPEVVEDLPKKRDKLDDSSRGEPVAETDQNPITTETSNEEQLKDPITTFSNWWSTSGSSKVSSFWEKATEQASQLRQKVAQQETTAISLDAIKSSLPVNINIDNINSNLKDLATNLNATATIHDLTKQLTKFVVGETEEVLRIHLVHDLVNLDYLQRHVQDSFERVLGNQVQGNVRVFVDEWSKPNTEASASSSDGSALSQLNIFSSGRCQLNVFEGKISDGEKLAFANLDNAVKLFTKSREEIAEQQKQMETSRDSNDNDSNDSDNEPKSNISDVFMSILPIAVVKNSSFTGDESESIVTTDSTSAGNFSFTIVLRDVTNDITTITRSQGFPLKWVKWVERSTEANETKEKGSSKADTTSDDDDEDNEMEEIDAGEWVQDWLEDGISLAIGIVAQNYVINRMGL